MKPITIGAVLCAALCFPVSAFGQEVISAQAGMINFTAGRVLLNQKPVEVSRTRFPQMKEGDVLTTEEGRAEVLLNPGSFLRVGENASFTLVSASLTSWRLELAAGSFIFELAGISSEDRPEIRWKRGTLTPLKRGVYRIDTDPPTVRVLEGEALLRDGDQTLKASKGRQLVWTDAWAVQRADANLADSLDLWSERRAGYLAQANVQAALRSPRDGFYGNSGVLGYWVLNPWLGMMTYIPASGAYNSFYGYSFYSYRSAVDMMYSLRPTPPRTDTYRGGGVYSTPAPNYPTVSPTPSGTSGTVAAGSPASTSSAGAGSAPISRQAGDASGRTR